MSATLERVKSVNGTGTKRRWAVVVNGEWVATEDRLRDAYEEALLHGADAKVIRVVREVR